MSNQIACFKCDDGNTPLYCLNCANDQLRSKCERLEGEVEHFKAQAGEQQAIKLHAQKAADNYERERNSALVQCAEMRSALELFRPMREQILSNTVTTRAFDKALSTDCGKAILLDLQRHKDALEKAAKALRECANVVEACETSLLWLERDASGCSDEYVRKDVISDTLKRIKDWRSAL